MPDRYTQIPAEHWARMNKAIRLLDADLATLEAAGAGGNPAGAVVLQRRGAYVTDKAAFDADTP